MLQAIAASVLLPVERAFFFFNPIYVEVISDYFELVRIVDVESTALFLFLWHIYLAFFFFFNFICSVMVPLYSECQNDLSFCNFSSIPYAQ